MNRYELKEYLEKAGYDVWFNYAIGEFEARKQGSHYNKTYHESRLS